jgi:hypothetical protein
VRGLVEEAVGTQSRRQAHFSFLFEACREVLGFWKETGSSGEEY